MNISEPPSCVPDSDIRAESRRSPCTGPSGPCRAGAGSCCPGSARRRSTNMSVPSGLARKTAKRLRSADVLPAREHDVAVRRTTGLRSWLWLNGDLLDAPARGVHRVQVEHALALVLVERVVGSGRGPGSALDLACRFDENTKPRPRAGRPDRRHRADANSRSGGEACRSVEAAGSVMSYSQMFQRPVQAGVIADAVDRGRVGSPGSASRRRSSCRRRTPRGRTRRPRRSREASR